MKANRRAGTRHSRFAVCDARGMFGRWVFALVALVSCSATDLEHRIDALVESSPAAQQAFVGIHVVDASSGVTLYKRNEDRLFLPASNVKLLTTALVLDRLGSDYRMKTRVLRDDSGNLILLGAGDPSLGGRTTPVRRNGVLPRSADVLEALADQIVASGITEVEGDIVGDDRAFVWDPYPASWTHDDTLRDFGAPVSALALNENTVGISIAAGVQGGDPARLTVSPPFEYFTIDNRIVTVPRRGTTKIALVRAGSTRQWRLEGSIALGDSVTEYLPVDDPALFAASTLFDSLTRRGVAIRGVPKAHHRNEGEAYQVPAGSEIAAHVSPPLSEILKAMDKASINLYAEILLREVGREKRNNGSTGAGLAEMVAYLREIGAASSDLRIDDGSGLSRNDLLSPRLLTQVLVDQHRKHGEAFVELLPGGGEEGTLDRRLCCISEERGVHAKTGTLARALALSGYAESKRNGRLAFAILVNDFSSSASEVRAWIDKIVMAMLSESAR